MPDVPSNASSSPEDAVAGMGNGAGAVNGNGPAGYPGWSGLQGQQDQSGFTAGYSPILDSRFKHLW